MPTLPPTLVRTQRPTGNSSANISDRESSDSPAPIPDQFHEIYIIMLISVCTLLSPLM